MAEDFLTQLFAQSALELLKLRLVRVISVASPGAGNEWAMTVPGGVTWEPISVISRFQTSAVIANRLPQLAFKDADSNVIGRVASTASQAAGAAVVQTFFSGEGTFQNSGAYTAAMPDPPYPLMPGYSIGSLTSSIDVGDTYTQIFLTVREWDVTGIIQEAEELTEQFEAYIALRAGRT